MSCSPSCRCPLPALTSLSLHRRIDIIGRGDCCWFRLDGIKMHLGTKFGDDKGKNDPECTPGVAYTFTSASPSKSISCSNRVSAQYRESLACM